ncbi:MAG: radical SAM protein [Deltaproteobacteria bacterium]|nr:radical SAM protein [Deltaproteobacteria bacterium]
MIPVIDGRKFFGTTLGKQRFPLNGQWELTCRCNLHCVMCYTDPFNQPARIQQELSTTEILRVLGEIAKEGCLNLVLTGGEPLARPDFFEIYEAAHRKGIFLTVFTNGTLITEKTADRFAQFPPERIEISLHGMSRPIFEKVTTGKGSFDYCLKAIDLLVKRKIPLTLKTTAMTLNETEILAVKKYADHLKMTGDVRFRLSEKMRLRLVGFDSANSSSLLRGLAKPDFDIIDDVSQFQVSEDSLRKMESQDEELTRAHHEELESSKTPYTCASQFHSFHIDAYGRLQMCSENRRASYDLRKGTFREGFYEAMPHFPCAFKIAGTKVV